MDGTPTQGRQQRLAVRQRTDETLFRTLAKLTFLVAGLVVLFWFLYQIRQAVLLLIVALILTMVLNAPVTWLERRRVSRGIAILLVLVAVLGVSGLLGWLVVPRLVEEVPTLIQELPQVVEAQVGQLSQALGGVPEIEQQFAQFMQWAERGVGEAWRIAGSVIAAVLFFLFVVAMFLYMVADPRPMLEWYVRSMPPHLRESAVQAFHRSSKMVVGWILANAIMGGLKATGAFIFLTWMEVPGAIVWSLLALFAALVPQLGFYLMSIPPVAVAMTVSPTTAIWTLVFFILLSEFLGKFVAPRVQGEMMELHAAYLLFMVLAMGLVFGALGVIVSGPVAGFLKVFYEEFYLKHQPEDAQIEQHVEHMMSGSVEGARGMKETVGG
jgi:putative permease